MSDLSSNQELLAKVREQYVNATMGDHSDGEGTLAALAELSNRIERLEAESVRLKTALNEAEGIVAALAPRSIGGHR